MRIVKLVNIEGLLFDKLPINPEVLELVYFILSGGEIPPIKIKLSSNGWFVSDGRHRLAAYKLLGIKQIKAKHYDRLNKITAESNTVLH